MNKIKKLIFFIVSLSCLTTLGFSQHKHSSQITEPILHHEIDAFIGNAHIPTATLENSTATVILPNVGLNYKYWFDERFAIGWYNNLLARTFTINSDTNQEVEKKYPFATTIVGVFRPWKKLGFFAGPGLLIDNTGSQFVVRLGLEYGFALSNDWYITPRFMFDSIGGEIESYTLGISIGRNF